MVLIYGGPFMHISPDFLPIGLLKWSLVYRWSTALIVSQKRRSSDHVLRSAISPWSISGSMELKDEPKETKLYRNASLASKKYLDLMTWKSMICPLPGRVTIGDLQQPRVQCSPSLPQSLDSDDARLQEQDMMQNSVGIKISVLENVLYRNDPKKSKNATRFCNKKTPPP